MKAIILGTGPSLNKQKHDIARLKKKGFKLFGVNNTFNDFDLDVWIACDPSWHNVYGKVKGNFDKWHWDVDICNQHGYKYIEGRWGDGENRCSGLSEEKGWIAYGHSSGFQALGLAVQYGADEIYLCGFDMRYDGDRHYFSGLSEENGEYPESLRKYSEFDGLIACYETIPANNPNLKIYNATKGSALTCFPFANLADL